MDYGHRLAVTGWGLHTRAGVHTGRAAAGTRAEDLLPSRPCGDLDGNGDSARHLRHVLGALHSLQRLPVSHAAPDADHDEAESSIDAREHGRHVAVFGRRVHAALCGFCGPAVRAELFW